MKVEYEFYKDIYGGGIVPIGAWKRMEQKAEQRLEYYTFGRTAGPWDGKSWENQAKCAVCEMAESVYEDEKRGNKTSEDTDGYLVSFDTSRSAGCRWYDIACVYLENTGLMNLGIDEDDYEC